MTQAHRRSAQRFSVAILIAALTWQGVEAANVGAADPPNEKMDCTVYETKSSSFGLGLRFGTMLLPVLAEWPGWPLLFAVLLLHGGFMSVIVGMFYKIVPFLVWLHLQDAGRGRLMAPNMKKVLAEKSMEGQMRAHFATLALLVAAVIWPAWLIYPAGFALLLANAWLLRNLFSALGVYRDHLARIAALEVPGEGGPTGGM